MKPPAPAHFDGATYEPPFDYARLNAQLRRVYDAMSDGRYRTLAEVSAITGDPEASISARLRDLRKPRFGALTVQRAPRGSRADGLFAYRLRPHSAAPAGGDTTARAAVIAALEVL